MLQCVITHVTDAAGEYVLWALLPLLAVVGPECCNVAAGCPHLGS